MVSFGNLYNTHVVPLATMYFLSFCRFFGKAKDYLLRIYATSEIVRLLTDKSYITTLRVYHFLIAQKTEPDVIPWISTAWVASHPERVTQTLQFVEKYDLTADYHEFDNISFEEDKMNPIIISKTKLENGESGYIVRCGGRGAYNDITFESSKAKFISIEYTHPDLSAPIGLTLDRSWFFVGNEIFNPTFILRMLEYQSEMYFFDNDYVVKIMDANCNIFTITPDKYILLTKDGYEVNVEYDSVADSEEEVYDGSDVSNEFDDM